MADNNILSEDTEVSDIESARFIKKPIIYHAGYQHSEDRNNQRKYNTLILVGVASICLLIGLIAGGYLQQMLNIFGNQSGSNTMTTTGSFNDFDPNLGIMGRNRRRRKKRRRARKNEAECSARRCCSIRDELSPSDLPYGLDCTSLTDEECGHMDEYCEWDCDPPRFKNGRLKRKFNRISLSEGVYRDPVESNNTQIGDETYEQCLEDAKLIGTDDCGVEYEEELDPEMAALFCGSHEPENASRKGGIPSYNGSNSSGIEEGDGYRRLYEIGDDGRIEVTSTAYPYRAVLYFEFYNQHEASWKRCTATMISPRWALTAAHCLWGDGDWFENSATRPYKAYKNVFSCSDRTSSNRYSVNRRVIWNAYKTAESKDHDVGLMRLSVDPGLGYLDFGYNSDFGGTESFNDIQYPGDKPDCSKWRQFCEFGSFYTYTMTTGDCDTSGGTSGSGVYKYWASGSHRIIFGIHVSEYKILGIWKRNRASRITSGKYNTICNYVEQNDPNHCDDEHDSSKFA